MTEETWLSAGGAMSGSIDDSRTRDAEQRDFVADFRDDVADARDATADAREAASDARQARLNARESELDARTRHLAAEGHPATPTGADRAGQARDGRERSESTDSRRQEKGLREEATARRLAEGRPSALAVAFASLAEQLYAAGTTDEVLARIAEAAVATVAGGGAASVTLVEADGYRSTGSTTEAATEADQAQYDADEGPSLDAVTDPVVAAPAFPDERWPHLGAAPADYGMQSSVSYQLRWPSREGAEAGAGSLNIYGFTPDAFDETAMEIGAILAAHASLAARAVGERTSLERLDQHLEEALLSRDVIGQAKGILMERLKTTPDEAFQILKDSSQRLNVKLREVARSIAETGELKPGPDSAQ
jgi:hypothetical protein